MQHLSQTKLKTFASLHLKKFRYSHGLCILEGWKLYEEAVRSGVNIEAVIFRNGENPQGIDVTAELAYAADEKAFGRLTVHKQPEGLLTVIHLPTEAQFSRVERHHDLGWPYSGPILLLYDIQDPGNLGTLIRTVDWFGLEGIICSTGTADCWNPKVIRASMGSVLRTRIAYVNDFFGLIQDRGDEIWVADMGGKELNSVEIQQRPFALIGNEANGIPRDQLANVQDLEYISIGKSGHSQAESLNAAVSGSILAHQYFTSSH